MSVLADDEMAYVRRGFDRQNQHSSADKTKLEIKREDCETRRVKTHDQSLSEHYVVAGRDP